MRVGLGGIGSGFVRVGIIGGGGFFGVGSGVVSLSKLGVGSGFDGGACFCGGA